MEINIDGNENVLRWHNEKPIAKGCLMTTLCCIRV